MFLTQGSPVAPRQAARSHNRHPISVHVKSHSIGLTSTCHLPQSDRATLFSFRSSGLGTLVFEAPLRGLVNNLRCVSNAKPELGWSAFPSRGLGTRLKKHSLFTVARKLSTTQVILNNADVADTVKQARPRDVVQTISYATDRASFDHITESTGLRLEK